jgi:hypothetical protein
MLGKAQTTGRDSFLFFGADGELMSVKSKNFKIVLRYTANSPTSPAVESGYIKPQCVAATVKWLPQIHTDDTVSGNYVWAKLGVTF